MYQKRSIFIHILYFHRKVDPSLLFIKVSQRVDLQQYY